MSESQEYLDWLNKFEVKKTTDSCFTPPAIYDAVKNWAVKEYSLQGLKVLRPFIPNGDYQAESYPENCVVIDNPPFSLASEIVKFYEARNVKYLLFANHLTLFSPNAKCSIITATDITFTNGAKIGVSFLTNLDPCKIRTAPELKAAIEKIEQKAKQAKAKPLYKYPNNLVSAALLGKVARTEFKVMPSEASEKVSRLDSQKEAKKAIFGYGFLLGDNAAKRHAQAQAQAHNLNTQAQAQAQAQARPWTLSDREKEIIAGLK